MDGTIHLDLERRFSHDVLINNQPELSARLQAKAKELAYLIDSAAVNSREKSKALARLEECVHWAHAAIAQPAAK